MAKVYEALQKAEEERRRKAAGEARPVAALKWSASAEAQEVDTRPFWRRWLEQRNVRPVDGVGDLNRRRISILQPESYVAEQFRTLRGRIDSLAAQRPMSTLAITSANTAEGKSTAAVNLAAVTSMSVGRQTLLVDCDLRQPQIHRSLGLEPRAGLAEVLLGEASLDEALLNVEGVNLQVLAVRGQPVNPSELLASSGMLSLLDEVGRRFDRVIFDTPATLGLPDAKVVSELCDGIVLVVRADVTPREDIELALDILDRSRLLGVVLNGSDSSRMGYGYY